MTKVKSVTTAKTKVKSVTTAKTKIAPIKSKALVKDVHIDDDVRTKAKEAKDAVKNITHEDVVTLVKSKPNQSRDKDLYDEYLHMFDLLKKNIRVFEKELKYSRSTRNVYALVALYSQQREVIADIRSISDYTENVNRILSKIIQPLFNDVTQSNLDIFYHIRKLVIETCKDDQTQYTLKRLEDLMREQARYLQDKYESTSERLTDIVANGK